MSLLDKAKSTVQKGADKAKEVGKAGQERLEAEKTKRRVNDLKEELGGLVYAQRTGKAADDVEAEIQRVIDEITEAEASLEADADSDAEES